MKIGRDFRGIERALRKAGWTYAGMTGSGHAKYSAPEGSTAARRFVTLQHANSDYRAVRNMRRTLRRDCNIDI